jgi:hypothetical protein
MTKLRDRVSLKVYGMIYSDLSQLRKDNIDHVIFVVRGT